MPSNGPAIQQPWGATARRGLESKLTARPRSRSSNSRRASSSRGAPAFVLCVLSPRSGTSMTSIFQLAFFGDASAAFVVGCVPAGYGLAKVVRGGDGSLRGGVTHAFKKTPGATCGRRIRSSRSRHRRSTRAEEDRQEHSRVSDRHRPRAVRSRRSPDRRARRARDADPADRLVPGGPQRGARHLSGPCPVDVLAIRAYRRRCGHRQSSRGASSGLLRDGVNVALYAHGAGITRYAALLRWHNPT